MKITNNINTFILNFMGQYSISPLIEEASSRIYYRIRNKKNSYIFLDARNEKKQFNSQLNVYKILKDINISIPKILKYNKNDCLMILEDFGDNRFDKRINSLYRSRHLFNIAIKSLIILKNSVYYEKKMKLHKYNFINLKNEISEFIDW